MSHTPRTDGFGAQFQTIIYTAIWAELHDREYVYTPFTQMEHNYDGDPDFLRKKEDLINFMGHFPLGKSAPLDIQTVYDFFEENMELCTESQTLAKIKKIFRENKSQSDYFDDAHIHIAIHIRRPNSHDSRIAGANIPDAAYLGLLPWLREKYAGQNVLFHIYSQGDEQMFAKTYGGSDVALHINTPLEETFASMVFADQLVTSASSLSYVAGILSDSPIYYVPFWHPPLPGWMQLQ